MQYAAYASSYIYRQPYIYVVGGRKEGDEKCSYIEILLEVQLNEQYLGINSVTQ